VHLRPLPPSGRGHAPAPPVPPPQDKHGRTYLHYAAYAGSLDLCKHLVDGAACPVDAPDGDGDSALSIACNSGQVPVAEFLLERGASAGPLAEGAQGPLHTAAASGSKKLMAALLDAGADINAPSPQGPPLCWAAGRAKTAAVSFLIERGADVARRGPDGLTPVFAAAATGEEDCVAALLSAGAEAGVPAAGGNTPLHVAAVLCRPGLVAALLGAGAAASCSLRSGASGDGDTPLEAAARSTRGSIADRRAVLAALLPHSPAPAGLPEGPSPEAVDAWGRERGGRATDDPAEGDAGGDDSAVSSRRAVIPEPDEHDVELAAARKREGDEAFVSQRWADAVAGYTSSLRHDTRNAVVWANRAAASLKLSRPEDALRDAMASRTLDPGYVKAWFREGKAYQALGRFQEAAEALYMALEKDRDNDDLMNAFLEAVEEGKKAHAAAQGR